MAPTLAICFAPQHAPFVLMGCPGSAIRQRRVRVTNGSACYADTTDKWTAATLQPLPHPRRTVMRNFQWAELWLMHLV